MQDLCSKLCRSQQLQRLISRKMKRPIFLRGKKNVIELVFNYSFGSCCSVTKSCLTICNPMANTLATWCKELTHRKRPRCWERLRAGGEGSNRGWDGWMASPTQWTWVWVNSGSDGQGGLVCCSPRGHKESDMAERLNNKLLFIFTDVITPVCRIFWIFSAP